MKNVKFAESVLLTRSLQHTLLKSSLAFATYDRSFFGEAERTWKPRTLCLRANITPICRAAMPKLVH